MNLSELIPEILNSFSQFFDMTIGQLGWLTAGVVVGGFINGLAGFGTALFALAFFLNALSPIESVAFILVIAVFGGGQGIWLIRHEILIQKRRLFRFLIPAPFGIPIGIYILTLVDSDTLSILVAGFLIFYGGYFSLQRNLPVIKGQNQLIDILVSFFSGILGGAFSLSGMLITVWSSLKPWTKVESRSLIQVFNFVVLGITMISFIFQGIYTFKLFFIILIMIPVSFVSVQSGLFVYKKLSTSTFRRLLISLTLLSGIIILARVLLSGTG